MKNKKILYIIGIVLLVAIVITGFALFAKGEMYAENITLSEAQSIIDGCLDKISDGASASVVKMCETVSLEAKELDFGSEKNIVATCDYTGVNVGLLWEDVGEKLLSIPTVDDSGRARVALKIAVDAVELVKDCLENNPEKYLVQGEVKAELFEKEDGIVLWRSRDLINTLFGGVLDISLEENGATIQTPLKKGIEKALFVSDEKQPDVSVGIFKWWNSIKATFKLNFIDDARWQYIAKGLLITLRITAISVIIGIVLGFIVAIVRTTHDKTGKLKIFNWFAKLYLTVIRGTPVIVQLMIIYFVILMPLGVDKMIAAYVCFGINSGAYVAEIIRGGIMSIDAGQMEAGRSLGFNYVQTMWYIIIPQTVKAVLPALANEFIVLLKESSVASYVGIVDLTQGGNIIRGVTYSAFMPLVAVALIYLALVMGLSKLVELLERRLNKSDRG